MGILDFGFWDFGDFGFWILRVFGDFGFRDFGDFVDFGDFGILDFGILGFWGGPGDVPLGNLVTVPGGQRLESMLACVWGPLNIFSEVRTLQNHRKTLTSNPGQNFTKSPKNLDSQPTSKQI